MRPIAIRSLADALVEHWAPRVVAEVDDAYVKVAKLLGSFVWHAHEAEDEFFLVLRGRLRIELEGGAVELAEGDGFVVPKGVRHRPVADEECLVMLVERRSTLHTGGVATPLARSVEEQVRGSTRQDSGDGA